MDQKKMTALEKIDAIGGLLDKLTDAHGRAKCGYIWSVVTLVEDLRSDVLIMEEQLKDIQNGIEIEIQEDGNEQCESG